MKYCIALYNLHLTGNVPPTPEEKQHLIRTVWLNYEMPPAFLGEQPKYALPTAEELKIVSEKPEGYTAPGYLLPTVENRLFSISAEDLNYYPPDVDWWQEGYDAFLNEYAHLTSFVDGYLEEKLRLKDREWLDRALQSFTTKLVGDYGDDFVAPLDQLDAPFPLLNGKKMSDVVKEIDIAHVKAKLCPNFHQMTANTIILIPAYLEFIQLLDEKPTLYRCNAYKTPKTPACQNVFVQSGKQGPQQQYCSSTCRVRIGKHEKTYHDDKIKHLRGER